MQLSTFCQSPLNCVIAILYLCFINMTNTAIPYNSRSRGHHVRDFNRHYSQRQQQVPVVAEAPPPPLELQEPEVGSDSSSIYDVNLERDYSPDPSMLIPSNTTSARHECPSCQLREHQKALRIESIKNMILNKLRMSHAPNISRESRRLAGIPPVEHYIRNFVPEHDRNMQGDDPNYFGDTSYHHSPGTDATTEKMITFAKRSLPHVNQTACCYFNISDQLDGYSVARATLYVYVKSAKIIVNPKHQLIVQRVVTDKNGRNPELTVVQRKRVQLNTRHGEWMNVEFTQTVQKWHKYPEENLGIAMELLDDEGNNVVVTDVSENNDKKPFLQLRLRYDRLRRNRRASNDGPVCFEKDPQEQCCRYHLAVDFSSFNWDWIIAPNYFIANYCSGSCPRMINAEYPHTHILSMLGTEYPQPCCSASDMSSLPLIYFDDDFNIKLSELPNMIVERCSCF